MLTSITLVLKRHLTTNSIKEALTRMMAFVIGRFVCLCVAKEACSCWLHVDKDLSPETFAEVAQCLDALYNQQPIAKEDFVLTKAYAKWLLNAGGVHGNTRPTLAGSLYGRNPRLSCCKHRQIALC